MSEKRPDECWGPWWRRYILCGIFNSAPCSPEWVGRDREALWARCQACGALRVFLTSLDEVHRRG
mgnify:CR=1 FL=1